MLRAYRAGFFMGQCRHLVTDETVDASASTMTLHLDVEAVASLGWGTPLQRLFFVAPNSLGGYLLRSRLLGTVFAESDLITRLTSDQCCPKPCRYSTQTAPLRWLTGWCIIRDYIDAHSVAPSATPLVAAVAAIVAAPSSPRSRASNINRPMASARSRQLPRTIPSVSFSKR